MIKVSVIVPIYGVEQYLRQCVDSILNQSLKEIEVILVDDGSKDQCPEIIDAYAEKDQRVRPLHLSNGGYGRAVNHGLRLASGETISIVEPDDWIMSTMLERLYETYQKHQYDIVKTPFINILSNVDIPEKWKHLPTDSFTIKQSGRFLSYHPSIWSCLYRTEFLKQHKIQMSEHPGAGWTDNLFQVQTLCYAQSIVFLNEPFYCYRRLQSDEKALKDWHIPFERTKEIHAWLDKEKIVHPEILGNLCKRELAYIAIVAKCDAAKKAEPEILSEIESWLKTVVTPHFEAIKAKLKPKELKTLQGLNFSLKWTFWKMRYLNLMSWKAFRRCIFSIKTSRGRFYFSFLGILFAKGVDINRPAWLKIQVGASPSRLEEQLR